MVFLEIHCRAAHCHCNVVTHCANVTNQDSIVRKAVALIRNAHADKFVQLVNVEVNAIQETVWKVNYVKTELVLLAVEIIWTVRRIDRA